MKGQRPGSYVAITTVASDAWMLPGRAAGDTPTVVSLRLHCGFRGVREKRSRTFSGQSVHIPSLENECPTVAVDRETNYENDPLAVSAIYLQRAITAGSRGPSALVGISPPRLRAKNR
jgi:hypothetical protein